MGLRINQNIAAQNAYRNLSVTDNQMSKSLEKLSSGFRINRAADDAAGLSISEGLRSQIGGLKVAVRNAQDGVNVVQTADGALNESTAILQRMRDLAVQSSNDTNDQTSRDAISAEATALNKELDRIASKTTFNNVNLLDGTFKGKQFQVGYAANDTIQVDITSTVVQGAKTTFANGGASLAAGTLTFSQTGGPSVTTAALTASTDANNIATQLNADANFKTAFTASVDTNGGLVVQAKDATINSTITIGAGLSGTPSSATSNVSATGGFSSTALGVSGVNLGSQSGANSAIGLIDTAIKSVSSARGNLGALQNRFEHTVNNLNVAVENLSASESQIRDTDMAAEMTSFTRAQILQQAGTSMLAQANSSQQSVLKLLG
jgi:flagellin